MTAAAMIARRAANSIFSTATSMIGNGASNRSSISRPKEKSSTRGRAVLCRPVVTSVSPTMPGNSRSA